MDAEIREWLDRCAITDLIHRYSDAVTRADWTQCAEVFSPDVLWESPVLGLRYESRDEFLDTLRPTTAFDILIQTPHAPVVTFTGADGATATTTIHEMNRGLLASESAMGAIGSPINFETYGIYYDTIRRIDGAWKFTHRLFVPFLLRNDCVTGDVVTARSGLPWPDLR